MPNVNFLVPGSPQGQPRHRVGLTKSGKHVAYLKRLKDSVTGRRTHEHPVVAWKSLIGLYASTARHPDWPIQRRIPLGVLLSFQRTPARNCRLKACIVRPDLDNYMKAALDALHGVVFEDDSQIVYAVGMKRYGMESNTLVTVVWGSELEHFMNPLESILNEWCKTGRRS